MTRKVAAATAISFTRCVSLAFSAFAVFLFHVAFAYACVRACVLIFALFLCAHVRAQAAGNSDSGTVGPGQFCHPKPLCPFWHSLVASQIIFFCAFAAHAYCRPYADLRINRLETASITCFIVSLWMGVTLSLEDTSATSRQVLSVCIILVNVGFFAATLAAIAKAVYDRHHENQTKEEQVVAHVPPKEEPDTCESSSTNKDAAVIMICV